MSKFNQLYLPAELSSMAMENPSQYSALKSSGSSVAPAVLGFLAEVAKNPQKAFSAGAIQKLVDTVNSTSITIQQLILPDVTDANSLVHQLQLMSNNH